MSHLRPVPDDPGNRPGSSCATEPGELLRRSATGDQDAFALLYDAISPKIYGLVLRVVRNPAMAEEIAQEAFLEIWRTASRYDPERGSAQAWMLTIAHRRAVDRVRAAEAANRRELTFEQHHRRIEHDVTAEAAEAAIEGRRVRTALGDLTPTQRQAVELAYLGGYTHTEVATMLDIPLGTAKTRIRDGLIRLRDTLGVGGTR